MSDQPVAKCEEGLPPWVATFADLMSLLMCFFVLLLSFATMDANRFKKMAESMQNAFGVQREVIAYEVVKGVSVVAEHFSPATTDPTILEEVKQQTTDTEKEYLDVPDQEKDEQKDNPKSPGQSDQEVVTEIQKEYVDMNEKRIEQAEELADEVREFMIEETRKDLISVDTDKDRVVIRIHEKGSFPSGSAEFNPAFLPVMDKIASVVSASVGTVLVAGHTDNIPINTPLYRSNWALSASRAVTVAHAILDNTSVDKKRIIVEGHADSVPLKENDTPEGRAANRRVEIILIEGDMPQQQPQSVLEVAQ